MAQRCLSGYTTTKASPYVYSAGGWTCVMDLVMPCMDEYVVMSYNTDPAKAASRVLEQAKYATKFSLEDRRMPRVFARMETGKGVGRNTSYGDTPGKESKAAVLNDMLTIERTLQPLSAFGGVLVHHWAAW
ncbi:hypothetical protein LTR74_017430 [Friedmanniomyces endolithicus]|nr:hypothetical protein LTR74_017430 [Friedmanniomyces endolithicus]